MLDILFEQFVVYGNCYGILLTYTYACDKLMPGFSVKRYFTQCNRHLYTGKKHLMVEGKTGKR